MLTIKSSELRHGDVVACWGMRCLIDAPIHANDDGVYWTSARVLNRAEVSVDAVPHSYTPNGRWTIQGNDLARWSVIRRGVDLV